MRTRWSAAVVLPVLLALAGCVPALVPNPTTEDHRTISALRTDPDGRGLVAACSGGGCDGRARLVVHETPSRVDLDLVVEESTDGACPAIATSGSVAADFAQPLGRRTLWSGGRRLVPFDGRRLPASSQLPAGFVLSGEQGGSEPRPDGAVDVTDTWTARYADPAPSTVGDTCRPSRGELAVTFGPASAAPSFDGWTRMGVVDLRPARAVLRRQGDVGSVDQWSYAWLTQGKSVEVRSSGLCAGDVILGPTELLPVVRSLG